MSGTRERKPLFERLKTALEEGVRFAKGELTLRTIAIPPQPPQLAARDVVKLRRRLGMSQNLFAHVLNISPKTVQSWEQGHRRPSQAALRLLQVVQAQPELVSEIVAPAVKRRTDNSTIAQKGYKRRTRSL